MNDTSTDGTPPPGETPPPPPPGGGGTPPPGGSPRRLLRRSDDKMIGGVAAGLADHLGIDVAIIRILFVVTAIFSGIGLLAYLLLWLFVPTADGATGTQELSRAVEGTQQREPAFWIGIVLLVIGAVWLAAFVGGGFINLPGRFGLPFFNGGLLVPLVLIGIGVALWRSGDRDQTPPPPDTGRPAPRPDAGPSQPGGPAGDRPGPVNDIGGPERGPARDTDAGGPAEIRGDEPDRSTRRWDEAATTALLPPAGGDTAPPGPPAPPASPDPVWVPPPAEPRSRSPLGRITMALALLASGGLWLADQLRIVNVRPVTVVAAALLVIGAGLLVGAWFGRARWLILIGFLLVPVTLVGLVLGPLGIPVGGPVGQQDVRVGPGAGIAPAYEAAAGQLILDLRNAELQEDVSTTIRMGAGEVLVYVPHEVNVDVTANLGVGEINVLGRRVAGPDLSLRHDERDLPDRPADAPLLSLDIRSGVGTIEVLRTGVEEPAPSGMPGSASATPGPGSPASSSASPASHRPAALEVAR